MIELEQAIEIFKRLGIRYIGFSLDGATAKTHDYIRGKDGVFDHLLWVFKKMKEYGIKVTVVSTLHKGNIGEIEGIRNILLDHGVDVWQLQTANVRGRMPKEWTIDENDYYNDSFIIDEMYEGMSKTDKNIKILLIL